MDEKDKIYFLFFLVLDVLDTKIRFQLYFITPRSGFADFPLLSIFSRLVNVQQLLEVEPISVVGELAICIGLER